MDIKRSTEVLVYFLVYLGCYSAEVKAFEERLIETLEDSIHAENFTIYRLFPDGDLKIELISLIGDVDIYGSSKTSKPSYFEYEMKSDSCGIDTVSVPKSLARPVYIALYGHPNYLHSQFKLNIYIVKKPKVETYEDLVAQYEKYYFDDDYDKSGEKEVRQSKSEFKKSDVHTEEEQPLWVKILLGILEFGIDVII